MKSHLAFILALIGVVVVSPQASADEALREEFLSSPTAIRYIDNADELPAPDYPLYPPIELTESSFRVIQGQRTASGGCSQTLEGEIDSSRPETWVARAYEPASCKWLYEVGFRSAGSPTPEVDSPEPNAPEPGVGSDSGLVNLNRSGTPQSGLTQWYGWSTTQVDEPIRWGTNTGIDEEGHLDPTNRVKNSIVWKPDGTCAINAGTVGQVRYNHKWYERTEWARTSHDWQRTADDGACRSTVHSASFAGFRNLLFCPAATTLFPIADRIIGVWKDLTIVFSSPQGPTFVDYLPNEIVGRKDGTAYHRANVEISGGCQDWLRVAHEHGRTPQ